MIVLKRGVPALFAVTGALALPFAFPPKEETSPVDETGKPRFPGKLVLYQYDVCPFCCKTKAFLDYNRIPYTAIEVNPISKAEIKFSSYKKVPQAFLYAVPGLIEQKQVNGSGDIIHALLPLERKKRKDNKLNPDEEKYFKWVDDVLVHSLTVNIYRTVSESLQAFDYITQCSDFSAPQAAVIKYLGAAMMYGISHYRLKKRHNIEDERKSLDDVITEWTEAVGKKGKFHGGKTPDLADVAVFGAIRSVQNMDTFAYVNEKHSKFSEWFKSMAEEVGPSQRLNIVRQSSPDFTAQVTKVPTKPQ